MAGSAALGGDGRMRRKNAALTGTGSIYHTDMDCQ